MKEIWMWVKHYGSTFHYRRIFHYPSTPVLRNEKKEFKSEPFSITFFTLECSIVKTLLFSITVPLITNFSFCYHFHPKYELKSDQIRPVEALKWPQNSSSIIILTMNLMWNESWTIMKFDVNQIIYVYTGVFWLNHDSNKFCKNKRFQLRMCWSSKLIAISITLFKT